MADSVIDRLERFYIPEPNTGCWLWIGTVNNKGYGMLHILTATGQRKRLAHRTSYEVFVGQIPDGLCVLHACDVPCCINPRHLWLGTKKENTADMARKGRMATGLRSGAPTHKHLRRGVEHGRSRLTEELVRFIRNNVAESSRVLGNRFGINASHVRAIRRRERWKHLP